MSTPFVELYAVRGTTFLEVIELADANDNPVNTAGASSTFVLKESPKGNLILQKTNDAGGIVFNGAFLELSITEEELNTIEYDNLYYDLFLQLQGENKQKLIRGKFTLE